ncbi:doubled motif LPXTG anchor domain-containing protein [Pseudoflavonifractor sp. 60]|uniref:doubled motif LPXTG anchor domain-containing protein n=1 Tax=Pseudoflavonifractor sp. 60 TaxID=2304576 RepID=UPI00325A7AB4
MPLNELPEDQTDIEEEDVPLVDMPEEIEQQEEPTEIKEEDVPLADVPQTGDNSHIWGILTALSGAALIYLSFGKKREDADE